MDLRHIEIHITETFCLCYVEVGVGVDDFSVLTLKVLKFESGKGCESKFPITYCI